MGLSDYALTLYGSIYTPQRPINVTKRMPDWRRSIRRHGGFWTGTAHFVGTRDEMIDMYLNGLNRRLVESTGGRRGAVTWEGFLAETELTLDGVTYKRSMLDMMNACKVCYTKIGNNLITNPSVETVAWTDELSPTTNERTEDWAVLGDWSQHCVTRAGQNREGICIENGIAIEAEVAYQARIAVNVVSGKWVYKIKDNAHTPGDPGYDVAKVKSIGTGDQILLAEIGEENEVTTVRVILVEKTVASGGEIYADNAILSYSPVKSETPWYTDVASIAEFGRIEDILLEAEKTNAEAIDKAETELAARAWARSKPPPRMEATGMPKPDGLSMLFCGYVFTLNWLHIQTTTGEAQADVHIGSLVGESEFVTAGFIEENTMLAMVDASYPTRIWDKIKEITRAGDTNQNLWDCGVYADRVLHYHQTATTPAYHWRNGKLLDMNQSRVPPWEARPALTMIDGMPVGPGGISGNVADNPRNVFLEGVEFIAPNTVAILPEIGREVR